MHETQESKKQDKQTISGNSSIQCRMHTTQMHRPGPALIKTHAVSKVYSIDPIGRLVDGFIGWQISPVQRAAAVLHCVQHLCAVEMRLMKPHVEQ